jgi:hypothetical protein
MSAFSRHPLRSDYEAAALRFPPKNAFAIPAKMLSPQNRRVRYAVDLELARAKEFPPYRETRQLRRQVKRLGPSRFIPNEPVGPDEV